MQSISTFRQVISAFSNKVPLDSNIWMIVLWKWPSNQLGTYICDKYYNLNYIILLSWGEFKKFLKNKIPQAISIYIAYYFSLNNI